jgi:hypothetical protein
MTTSETFDQLAQLTMLYRSLLRHEDDKLSSYLEQDFDRAESLSLEEAGLVEAVRRLHEEIRMDASGGPTSSTATGQDRDLMVRHLDELNGAIRELQLVLLRSRRFVHHSLLHGQGLLAALFNSQHRGYDGKGDLRAEKGSLRRGMRA